MTRPDFLGPIVHQKFWHPKVIENTWEECRGLGSGTLHRRLVLRRAGPAEGARNREVVEAHYSHMVKLENPCCFRQVISID